MRAGSYHASPGEVRSVGGVRKLVDELGEYPGWRCAGTRRRESPRPGAHQAITSANAGEPMAAGRTGDRQPQPYRHEIVIHT